MKNNIIKEVPNHIRHLNMGQIKEIISLLAEKKLILKLK